MKKDVLVEGKSLANEFQMLMKDIVLKLGGSPVLGKLVKEVTGILREVENGAYAGDIRKSIEEPGFRKSFWKSQIYAGGYEFNSRGIHTLRVCVRSAKLAKKLIKKGKFVDLSLVVAIALAHDFGHFPFAHVAESELDKFLGCKWRHGQQGIWKYGCIQKGKFSELVLDGMLCHSEIERPLIFDTSKSLDAIEQLSGERFIPGSLEAVIVKIADKFGNAIDDIKDAGHNGVEIGEIYPLLIELGKEAGKIFEALINGISVEGNEVIIPEEDYDKFERMKRFCYGDPERDLKGKIHQDEKLLTERRVIKAVITKTLRGLEYFIETKMYLNPELDNLFLKKTVRSYLKGNQTAYNQIEDLPFIKVSTAKILAKDIFAELTEPEVYEIEANFIQFAHGDEGLHMARMKGK